MPSFYQCLTPEGREAWDKLTGFKVTIIDYLDVSVKLREETLEEVARIMRRKPALRKELDGADD